MQSAGTDKKESEVGAQCDYLESSLVDLSKRIDDLEARLSSVLRKSASVPKEPGDPEKAGTLVEHAARIRGFGDKVKRDYHRIQDILGRLEL